MRRIRGGRVQKSAAARRYAFPAGHTPSLMPLGAAWVFRARVCVAASLKRCTRCGHEIRGHCWGLAASPEAMAARNAAEADSPPKRARISIEASPRESQRRGTVTAHILQWAVEALPLLPPAAMLDVPGGLETLVCVAKFLTYPQASYPNSGFMTSSPTVTLLSSLTSSGI